MSDMQNTIFGTVEPTAPHNDDIVICSDDTSCRHEDAYYDCKGDPHSNEDDQKDANVEIVTEILDGVVEWSNDYHTGNSDYPDGAAYIVNEVSHDWPDRVKEWVCNEFEDTNYNTPHDDYMDELVEFICEGIDGCFDAEYNRNEYSCYFGPGCCLYSLDIGECEEQVEINSYPELKALHEKRELDDVLDNYNGEGCVSRSYRREKNEKTGYYENVGRETYMPYPHNSEHPDIMLYTMPGGQWHYVVPADRMHELVNEFLEERNGSDD